MSYLVDTDVAIEHLGGNTSVTRMLDRIAGLPLHLSSVTLAELYEGAFWSSNPNEHILAIQDAFRTFDILSPTEPVAIQFGELRASLRRRGRLIGDFDLLIAATALHYDPTLITFNKRHFSRIPDLPLYSYS